jgi:glycosyltransferase involved in cell wall biosynthesis
VRPSGRCETAAELLEAGHPAPGALLHGLGQPRRAGHLLQQPDDRLGVLGGQPRVDVAHNAVAVDQFPYRADKDDYVLFLGRMNPEKGADLAIGAARAAGRRLILAAKCNEPD